MSGIVKSGARLAASVAILLQFGVAQMPVGVGGGMMGGSMMQGPAVGPDGTAYVIRRTAGTPQMMGTGSQSVQTELVALSPHDGAPKWTLQVDGTMISQPVLGQDGTIFVTASEPPMNFANGRMPGNGNSSPGRKPALLVVTPARNLTRVELDGDILSVPTLAPDGQGGYMVYVIATDMPNTGSGMGMGGGSVTSPGGSFLYGFSSAGQQKFKVQLSQFQGYGMQGRM